MTTESERAKQRGQHRKQHLFMRSLSLSFQSLTLSSSCFYFARINHRNRENQHHMDRTNERNAREERRIRKERMNLNVNK